jgi:hypothetical protein
MNSFTGFMHEVNSGNVNWVKILQGSFTPALVATIAATFALSIEQALQFQQAVQGASLNSATSFGNTTAAMTNGAYAISVATGQSASDVETALGQVSTVYKNTADAMQVTNDISQFATTEQMSMAAATSLLLPLLQNWNISAGDVGNTIATLGESTQNGKLSIDQLASSLSAAGTSLQGKTSLSDAIADLQALSTVKGTTPTGILQEFATIVSGANNTNLAVDGIFGNMTTAITSGPNGLITAFGLIGNKMNTLGTVAATQLATQLGMTPDGINTALKITASDFVGLSGLANTFLKNLLPLQTWFAANQTDLDKFKEVWTTLIADLEVAAIPAVVKAMLDILSGADVLAKLFNEGTSGMSNPNSTISSITSGLSSNVYSLANSNNPFAGFQILADSFTEGIALLVSTVGGKGTSTAVTNNTTINNGTPGHVASTATTSQSPSSQ